VRGLWTYWGLWFMDFFPSHIWNWKNIWLKKHKNNGIDKIYITDNRIEWTRVEKNDRI